MTPLLDLEVNGRSIADAILEPVVAAGATPIVVDVGARNGLWTLPPSYARQARLIGFEPNPEEFAKLAGHKTDADKVLAGFRQKRPFFKEERYFPYALWDRDETRTLFVTRGAGATSLMGTTHAKLKNHFQVRPGADPAKQKNVYETVFHVEETCELACRRLDSLMSPGEKIDFLKLDVEGAELRVLRGATGLLDLRSVLFIETEFQLFPYYEEHPLLGHQHVFLAERGFRLLDLQLDHARQRRGRAALPLHNERAPLAAGDAFLCLDPDSAITMHPHDLHRLAAVSLAFGFSSWSLSLLRDAKLLSSGAIDAIELAIRRRPQSWRRRVLNTWNDIPHRVWKGANGLASLVRAR